MNQLLRAFARYLLASFLFVGLTVTSYAQSQTFPDVARGLQWLTAQIQADGRLLDEPQSIATKLQNRTETAQTLKLLANVPSVLTTGIAANTEDNTEYLSRKVISLGLNGWDTTNYIDQILLSQSNDGGFGGAIGYASNVLDTSWSVLAMAQTGKSGTDAASRARAYLISKVLADGGIVGHNDLDRVHQSAIALLALQTSQSAASATATRNLATWLLQQQAADGSWQGNSYLTAFTLAAVSPVTADATVRTNAQRFLLAAQAADGSWNADPFLTALALRALSLQFTPPVTTGILKGLIVDVTTNAPLSGATVIVAAAGNKTAITDEAGSFTITGIETGSYSVTFARSGYSTTSKNYGINAGQTTDAGSVGLVQLPTSGIIRGQVLAATSGTPLAGVAINVTGPSALTALTDASGRFEFTDVVPGAFTIAANLSGYQSATGSGTLVAGQTQVFSPSLYATNENAPTTVQYSGKVVAAGGSSLAGVELQITVPAGASTAVTDSAGQFNLTLPAGSYSVTFALSGYESITQAFIAPGGAIVNGGVVTLSPIRTVSTLKGRVLNTSGAPIGGATVQVIGTAAVATSGEDGSYSIANIAGTTLSVRASATGHNSQTIGLQLSKPTDIQHDFTLTVQGVGALSIENVTVSPSTVGSAADVTMAAIVKNGGTANGAAVILLQVLDRDRNIIGAGVVYDADGNMIGQLNLASGTEQPLSLVWNSAQHLPGDYSLLIRLVEVGSVTRETPQGIVMSERVGAVTVTEQAHFAGSITANPPVLQAGTNTAVKLSALIQNDGNIDMPAQNYTLSVVDTKDGSIVQTRHVAGDTLPFSGLQTLTFQDWTPAIAGSFRLDLTAANPAHGKVIGTLYVGDSAKAAYTVNKLVVPTGTQTVRGTIKITGQDIANGSISDPLVPLVKAAIQKSVTYNDREAAAWTTRNQCIGCHVQTQAMVGGETNRRFATFDQGQRNTIYNIVRNTQQADGSFYDVHSGYRTTSSMLNMWALDSWSDKQEVLPVLVRGADYLTSIQPTSGQWNYSHPWMGGWTSAVDHTALNMKSLVGLHKALQEAVNLVASYVSSPYFGTTMPLARGTFTRDQAGNFYMPVVGQNSVVQIRPDGTTGDSWTGMVDPLGIVEAKDGNGMLVATGGGLFRLTAGGIKTKLNSTPASFLVYSPDGVLYASNNGNNSIYEIDDAGVATLYVQSTTLNAPAGFAFQENGDILITSYNSRSLVWIRKSDKNVATVLSSASLAGNPVDIIRNGNSWLIATTSAIYRLNDEWRVERYLAGGSYKLMRLEDGTILFTTYNQAGIKRLSPVLIDVPTKLARYALSIDRGTTWLLGQNLNGGTDNLKLAHQLIGLGEAKKFFANNVSRAESIQTKMDSIASVLKVRQRADGGWGVTTSHGSDSFVTSHVGYALDYLSPSPDDPYIRKAVQWLLSKQLADGSWPNENGIFSTRLSATTWVSIWLPVLLDRLGGVDTDLSVTFPANVMMTNPDRVPTSTQVNSDATTTYLWSMNGVTSAGLDINYDLSLQDMQPDEVRPVSTDAHLTFKNTFTNGVVNAPIDVPRVKASAFLELGVATDKVNYLSNAVVGITGQVTNTGANLSAGKVQFDIYAPDNLLVTTAGTVPFSGVATGASLNLVTTWNTGLTLAAPGYYVLATLYDSADRLVGTAKTVFNILTDEAANPQLTAKLVTDKQAYLPSEVVQVSDRVVNATANALLNDLRVTTTVANPDGTVRFTRTEVLLQLAQGNLKDYRYSVPLNFAPAGQYSATLIVTAADGAVLGQSTARFAVGSSADSGSGLSGTLAASPKEVPLGDAVAISFGLTNAGNSALTDLPLQVSIVDPQAQAVVAAFPYQQSLNAGAGYTAATSWPSAGPVGTTYVAVLTATIGGKTLTLAQDNFTVIAPPVKLDLAQTLAQGNRVLVLVSCKDDTVLTAASATTACVTDRSQAIAQTLTELGVAYTITTTLDAFKAALRSGLYNTYWISGKEDKLHDDLASEVREAVFAGDGFLSDSQHDERNKVLDQTAGITWKGKQGETGLDADITGPLFAAQRLATGNRALSFAPNGSIVQAQLYGRRADAAGPAILTHAYGAGRAVTFAFDLVQSLQAQPHWKSILATSLQHVMPTALAAPASATPGSLVLVNTSVTNLARSVEVTVKSTLPQGGVYLGSSPTGSYDATANSIGWTFTLPESQNRDLSLTLRAPEAAGEAALQTIVSTTRNGVTSAYGDPLALAITVVPAAATAANAIATLQTLVLAQSKEQRLRENLVADLQSAMSLFGQNTAAGYEAAIGQLVQIIDALAGLPVDTTAVRLDLDMILKEAQWRWSMTQPGQ